MLEVFLGGCEHAVEAAAKLKGLRVQLAWQGLELDWQLGRLCRVYLPDQLSIFASGGGIGRYQSGRADRCATC